MVFNNVINKAILILALILLTSGCVTQKYSIKQEIYEDKAIITVNKSINSDLYENIKRNEKDFASPETQLELWLLREGFLKAECKLLNENNVTCQDFEKYIVYNFTTYEGFQFIKKTDFILGNESAHIIITKVKQPIKRDDNEYIKVIRDTIKESYMGPLPDLTDFMNKRIKAVNLTYLIPSTTLMNFEQNAILATSANAINRSYVNVDIRYEIKVPGYKIKEARAKDKKLDVIDNAVILTFDEIKNINSPIVIEAEKQLYPAYSIIALIVLIIVLVVIYKLTRRKKKIKKKSIDDLLMD
jgi:hypothetical protein